MGYKHPKSAPVSPDKRAMNFLRSDAIERSLLLPTVLAAILILVVCIKGGILDPLAQKAEACKILVAKQAQLTQIEEKLADYEALEQQYCRYSFGLMNDTEVSLVNRMDVLALAESKIAGEAAILDFTVNNNVLTMNLSGITLREAGAIVKDLESSPLVARVSVNSATADDGREAQIYISITLTKHPREAAE